MENKFILDECPTCGSDVIRKVRKKWVGEYKGYKYFVPSSATKIFP